MTWSARTAYSQARQSFANTRCGRVQRLLRRLRWKQTASNFSWGLGRSKFLPYEITNCPQSFSHFVSQMYAMQDVDAIGHMPIATLQITIVYSANAGYFRPNFTLSETQRLRAVPNRLHSCTALCSAVFLCGFHYLNVVNLYE